MDSLHLDDVLDQVTLALESYSIVRAARQLEEFVEDLTNRYIRRSRDRFWSFQREESSAKEAGYPTLYEVLTTLSKLIAPFTPFLAELLHEHLVRSVTPGAPDSVHLEDWPQGPGVMSELAREKNNDLLLLAGAMGLAKRIVGLGREARSSHDLKSRQPLASATLVFAPEALGVDVREQVERVREVILDELNVKAIAWAERRGDYVRHEVRPNFRLLGKRLGDAAERRVAWLGLLGQKAPQGDRIGFSRVLYALSSPQNWQKEARGGLLTPEHIEAYRTLAPTVAAHIAYQARAILADKVQAKGLKPRARRMLELWAQTEGQRGDDTASGLRASRPQAAAGCSVGETSGAADGGARNRGKGNEMKPASGFHSETIKWGNAPGSDDISMAADAYGLAIHTRGHSRVSVELYSAGGAASRAGSVYLQVSDDESNWVNVPLDNGGSGSWYWNSPYGSTALTVTTLTAFNVVLDLDLATSYIRPFWDYTSGTGTISGVVTFK